jgi:hydrogenase maturation protease
LHQNELAAGLALSQALGLLPENLLIFGIEPAQISKGIGLSPEVSASLPAVVDMISKNLEKKTA